ncbi:hypothetical protein ACVGVM_17850 [Pseudonocardia bannensis]|uniref:Uncharacterized protein n=1 Tax=Pseudonocardia bannensis TaxID=630973 RepID=A0A848DSA6_9PSEU|nr:hypothetical protein [Pseudonocardia bannensis]NMH95369.1 hypothetical protein [Pseudonocardia bannensis]
MPERQDEPGCRQHGAHAGLAGELRAFAITALDRLQPALERIRAEAAEPGDPAEPSATPASCAVCPICALIAALRGERPELATRLADQVSGLLAVLRSALDEGAGAPGPGPAEPAGPTGPARPVQHIPVHRP